MTEDGTAKLVALWRAGDEHAATELVSRYVARLIGLARSRLPKRFAHRIDPEDVVQSVYRTFFTGAREGRFELQRGGDMWRLLVAITLHKVHNQLKRNAASKRALDCEQTFGDESALNILQSAVPTTAPSPLDVVVLIDEVEQLMAGLDPLKRRMLELRLQGYTLDEIAEASHCSQRTVRRVLEDVKQQLERARGNSSGPGRVSEARP